MFATKLWLYLLYLRQTQEEVVSAEEGKNDFVMPRDWKSPSSELPVAPIVHTHFTIGSTK